MTPSTSPSPDGQTERNRALQQDLYGEPLADLVARLGSALGLTQGRLAEAVGLSPAMLSQLGTAHRVKIGNPAVLERLRALDDLAAGVRDGTVDPGSIGDRLVQVRSVTGVRLPRTGVPTDLPPAREATLDGHAGARTAVRSVQEVLRSVASAEELLGAARTLQHAHPGLAEVLRVYGAGRTSEALAHFRTLDPVV